MGVKARERVMHERNRGRSRKIGEVEGGGSPGRATLRALSSWRRVGGRENVETTWQRGEV